MKNPYSAIGVDESLFPLSCRNNFLPELAPSRTLCWLPGFAGPCPSTSLDKVPPIKLLSSCRALDYQNDDAMSSVLAQFLDQFLLVAYNLVIC